MSNEQVIRYCAPIIFLYFAFDIHRHDAAAIDHDGSHHGFQLYGVNLHVRNEHYSLDGKGAGIRHLLYDCIFHFVSSEMIRLSELEDAFLQYDPYGLKKLIINSFHETELSCDPCHINGLILYVIVQIIRISNNHLIKAEEVTLPDIEKTPENTPVPAGTKSRYQKNHKFSKTLDTENTLC